MESEKQYAMFIHLSQLAGSIVVGLGWILPLVLWLTKKDSSEYIDANGKIRDELDYFLLDLRYCQWYTLPYRDRCRPAHRPGDM